MVARRAAGLVGAVKKESNRVRGRRACRSRGRAAAYLDSGGLRTSRSSRSQALTNHYDPGQGPAASEVYQGHLTAVGIAAHSRDTLDAECCRPW